MNLHMGRRDGFKNQEYLRSIEGAMTYLRPLVAADRDRIAVAGANLEKHLQNCIFEVKHQLSSL